MLVTVLYVKQEKAYKIFLQSNKKKKTKKKSPLLTPKNIDKIDFWSQ